jgi:alpha-tubulin suppressor-like RCC1 family protein
LHLREVLELGLGVLSEEYFMKTYLLFSLWLFLGLVITACDSNSVSQTGSLPSSEDGAGGGAGPAVLTISQVSYDYGVQSVNSINNEVFTVSNSGQPTTVSASGLASAFNFEGGSYPGSGGTCTTTISTSCTLVVAFVPTNVVAYTGELDLNYQSANVPAVAKVALRGMGTNIASLRISLDGTTQDTTPYDFGRQPSAMTVTQAFKVIYAGSLPATGVTLSGLTSPFSISANTCGSTVSTGGCSFQVTYTANSSATQELKLTYDNSAYADQGTLSISGEMIPQTFPALLTINGGNQISFAKQLILHPVDMTVTISNRSNASFPATNLTPVAFRTSVITYKGASGFPGTNGTCTSTLAANSSCTVVLTFTPTTATTYSDALAFTYNNGVTTTTNTEAISAIGGNPALLTLSASSYNFGTQSLNFTTSKSFTLSNPSASIGATTIAFSTLAAPFSYSSQGCGTTLAAGSSCNFTIAFKPTAAASYSTTVTISYFDGNVQQSVTPPLTLSGAGTTAAKLVVNNINFGQVVVGNSAEASTTLTYYGSDPVVGFSVSGVTAPFAKVSTTCGASITASCTITFSFTPTAAQAYTDSAVLISFTDSSTMQSSSLGLTLTGTGVTPAVLSFSDGTAYSYGNVAIGASGSHTLTLSNSGTAAASSIVFSAVSTPFAKVSTTCGSSLQSSCTYAISFTPKTATSVSQIFSLTYFDGTKNQSLSINLTGTGFPLALVSVSNAAFGKVPVNATGTQSFSITNSGSLAASSLVIGSPTAPFSITNNGCAASLPLGTSCTVTLAFKPTSPGNFSQTISVSFNDGQNPKQLSSTITGAGTVPIQVSVGGDHSCVKTDLAQVVCWGHNNDGQLGDADTTDLGGLSGQMGNLPVVSLGAAYEYGAAKVVSGYWHSCALLLDGNVKCWGANFAGQLGQGDTTNRGDVGNMGDNLPVIELGTGRKAVDISAGYGHTCALLDNGSLKCWGLNAQGQLGQGTTANIGVDPGQMGDDLEPIDLGGTAVTAVSAGTGDTCAILTGGGLKCWGDNFYGQLGLGDWTNRGDAANEMGTNLPFVNMGTGRTVLKVASGGGYHCAVLDNGGVKCMGRNDVAGNLGVVTWCQDVAANAGPCGGSYTFALRGYGLAPNQTGDNLPFLNLGTGKTAVDIQLGQDFGCVLLNDGGVKCFGANDYGELGHGNTTAQGGGVNDMGDNLMETPLSTTTQALSLGATFACALLKDGTVRCWGDNRSGELGQGNLTELGDLPNQVSTIPAINWN